MARPPFKPTPALKRKVAIAAGGGMSHEEIALVLGISRNTLEKHFDHELSIGAYSKRFEVLDSLHKAATKKGSVAACKEYLKQIPAAAAPPQDEGEKPEVKKGKKEQAAEDAQSAAVGTDWDNLLRPTPETVQ